MFKKSKSDAVKSKLTRIQRLSLWFFHRPRKTAVIWLVIALFGILSYTTLLKREGFPSVATPFAVAKGSYLVHDPAKVDSEVAKPLSAFLLKQDGVKTVLSQSGGDFYNLIVNYKEGVNADSKSRELAKEIRAKHLLPPQATFSLDPYKFGFTSRGDKMVVSFYSVNGQAPTKELVDQAKRAAKFLKDKHPPLATDISVLDPFETAPDPVTGQLISNQKSFDRFGKRADASNRFYNSVVIGVQAPDGTDNIKLDDQVRAAVGELNKQPGYGGFHAEISASSASDIKAQINELQSSLLEGLFAVLIVGSIVIAIRASLVTVLSMITVIAAVNAFLYLTGYSLNTITLFALILGLSLIVDDTIIMVEALDSQRKRHKNADDVVTHATRRVSRAMIAATTTAVLSFAPLLFVGGILGGFIRAIPITIIASLTISLIVALIFIPMFARFLLLGKKQMGSENVHEVSAGVEAAIARFVSGPMLWAKGSTKKLLLVGITALVIGFGFVGAGGYLFQKVTFNIFPPAKDSNQIGAMITFPPNTDIQKAEQIADHADKIFGDTVGAYFVKASYYGQADVQTAQLFSDITNYNDRHETAPQIVQKLNDKYSSFKEARVEAQVMGVGPPSSSFTVQIKSGQNREAALKLAKDVANYLKNEAVLKRPDHTIAKVKSVDIGNSSIYTRKDGTEFVTVEAKFVDSDTTTLVNLGKDAVKNHYTAEKVLTYNLPKDAITFDTGQEQENQNSFKTLALAFPILLLVIYFVLSFQFRSLLQPILIFTALPFSLFGITLGLYLTHNAFSFFAMLGFFALIGLSIKNTILLTDYANQARKAGLGTVDAAHEALAERFRPLIATSLTAVFSLIPLTISSPFWEGLGVVLIFGLLSSTFLVITVFPYYYLGAEFLRQHINRRTGVSWLVLTIALEAALSKAIPGGALLAPFAAAILIMAIKRGYKIARS